MAFGIYSVATRIRLNWAESSEEEDDDVQSDLVRRFDQAIEFARNACYATDDQIVEAAGTRAVKKEEG